MRLYSYSQDRILTCIGIIIFPISPLVGTPSSPDYITNIITITRLNKHTHKIQNLVVLPFQVSSVVVVLPLYGMTKYSKTPLMAY